MLETQQQQQPRVIYVVQDGSSGGNVGLQLPALADSSQSVKYKTFVPHMLLACFVFWLFGFLFGLVAFTLARKCIVLIITIEINNTRTLIVVLLSTSKPDARVHSGHLSEFGQCQVAANFK